jgi:Ca2+:H+ antiporter
MIAQTLSSFMFVATGALILPAAFDAGLPSDSNTQAGVLALSRGTSIILLIIYILFLVYQLKTHSYVFEPEHSDQTDEADTVVVVMSPWVTGTTILVVATAVSFCSDFDDVVKSFGISKTFIGLILVPMVGNAGISFNFLSLKKLAELVTCLNLGYKNKMDLVVAITLGSCMQIALFLTPFLVILGWILNIPMTLSRPFFAFQLTHRFREFPGCGDFRGCYIHGIFDYGRKFQLDGRGNVIGCFQYRSDRILAVSRYPG